MQLWGLANLKSIGQLTGWECRRDAVLDLNSNVQQAGKHTFFLYCSLEHSFFPWEASVFAFKAFS